MPDLILASTSPYRRQLLERLGLPFRTCAPRCDEEALKDDGLAPRQLAEHLAQAKAGSIAADEADAVVIGSDQLAAVDERILGKPGDAAGALEQLQLLSGRSHQLITAVCIYHAGETHRHLDITTLHMRALDRPALERYIARDQPVDCAGAYKLEQAGISLFERIDSADHSAITGLPLIALSGILRSLGYAIP